jgi:glucose-1-phosphate cytidylyltransferase
MQTETGGRVKRVSELIGPEPFMLTYGDGVSDVDIGRLLEFHRAHGKLATMTAVRHPARFGVASLEEDTVTRFDEKPKIGEGWVNGGFFVLEPGVADYIEGDLTAWEREPMRRLAADRQLVAYRHDGFWQSMDTVRDVRLLEDLWQSGEAPWKVW